MFQPLCFPLVFSLQYQYRKKKMGSGSAFYKTYYLALGAVYIIVGSVPLGQMEALDTCKSRCPLAFPDREWKKWECALGPVKWDSLEGYRNAWVSFDNASCFVCESPSSTVLLEPCEPCEKYVEKVPSSKYSKSASCNDINTISQCSGANPPNFQPAVIANAGTRKAANTRDIPFTPEPDIGLRGQISPLTLGVAVIYVIQGVGCIIAGLGSGRFSGTYEDDWLKMSVTSNWDGPYLCSRRAMTPSTNFPKGSSFHSCSPGSSLPSRSGCSAASGAISHGGRT